MRLAGLEPAETLHRIESRTIDLDRIDRRPAFLPGSPRLGVRYAPTARGNGFDHGDFSQPNASTSAVPQPYRARVDRSAGAANPAASGKAAHHLNGAPGAIHLPNPRAAP